MIMVFSFESCNNSAVIPNNSIQCNGSAFNTSGHNPKVIGELNNSGSAIVEWNITAGGPQNSSWDVFVRFNYSSTSSPTDTKTIKTRIVDYPWWNTSFNCRRLVNVTQNTANNGSGVVGVREDCKNMIPVAEPMVRRLGRSITDRDGNPFT